MALRTLFLSLFLLALFRASDATSKNAETLGLLDSETALAEVACVQKTCGKFSCPAGYVALPADTVCGRGSCDQCSCCKRTQTCANWYTTSTTKCPSSARLIQNANQRYCNRTTCASSECCETLPTCRNYPCGNDVPVTPTPTCTTGSCSHSVCCQCVPRCENFNCNGLKAKCGNTQCPKTGCTQDTCCERPKYCNSYTCKKGFLKASADKIQCAIGECSDCTCCEERTCANFACGTNYMLKSGATSIKCTTGTCTQALCCDATCPTYQCPVGYRNNPLASSIRLCPPAGSTDYDDGDHGDRGDRHDDGGDHDGGDHDGGDHDGGDRDGGDKHDYSDRDSYGDVAPDNNGSGLGSHFRTDKTTGKNQGTCRMYNCGRDIPIYPSPLCGRGACNHFQCCRRATSPTTGGSTKQPRANCDRNDRGDRRDHHDDGGDHDGGDHDGGDHDGGDSRDGSYYGRAFLEVTDGSDYDGGDHDGGDRDSGDHDGGDRDGGDHHDRRDNDDDDDCDSRVGPTPCDDQTNCCIRNTCGNTPTGRAFACPTGSTLIVDAMTKNCAGDCLASECCVQQRAVCNATFPCRNYGQAFNPVKNGVICAGNPCTADDCCLPLCSTKNVCPSDRPTIASPTGVRCRANPCLVDECCVRTCASSSIRCGATQTAVSDYATHQCPRSTGDQFGVCQTSDCCLNTCTGFRCPSQTSAKPAPAGSTFITCPATGCRNSDCCVPNNCPANFQCGSGSRPKPNMATLPCDLATCRPDECCIQNVCRDTGAFSGCPAGTQNKPDFNSRACPVGSACRVQDCCNPVCPSGVVCGANKKPVSTMTVCSSGTCSEADCCVDKTCSDYTCRSNLPIPSAANTPCSGTACETTCCQQLDTCFSPTGAISHCPAGTRDRTAAELVRTCGLTCGEADCCIRTCDSYTCSPGKVKVRDAGMVSCAQATPADEGTCSDDICCLDTCASTIRTCAAGQSRVGDFNTHTCDGGCRSTDCCQDTCALFVCPAFYKPNPSASATVCSRNDATCRDVCCQVSVCPTDQSFCGAHYHLKDGQPGCRTASCTRDECCDQDVCFGTFVCNPAQGYRQRTDNPSCGGQDCTTDICCTRQTCEGYGGCSGGDWEFAPDMATRHCATSTCTDEECCIRVCNPANVGFCGSGKRFKDSNGALITCAGSPCTVDECCEDRTCRNTGYQCQQDRYRLKDDLNVVCEGPCNDADCCVRIPDTCFSQNGGVPECVGGLTRKPDSEIPSQCPGDVCIPSDCCVPTCATFECATFKDTTLVCPGGECTEDFCCQKFCNDFVGLCAPTDLVRAIACDTCDQATCCLPTCDSVTCDTGYEKAVPDMTPCEDCSNAGCCKQVVCGDYRCPAKWHPLESVATIWCQTGTCQDRDCCAPNTCAEKVCPAGQEVLDRTSPCAAVDCTDAECCSAITCDGVGYVCQAPLFRQPTLTGCLTHACSDEECCRPKCTADVCPATSGKHLKSGATDRLCDKVSGCTEAECCEDLTCGNSGFTCAVRPGQILTTRPATTPCPAGCNTDVCCLYQAPPGCFQPGSNIQRCDAGWSQKASPKTSCDVAGCSMSDCCDRTCALDAASLCVSRPPKLNLGSIVCSGTPQVCSEDDCCDVYCTNSDFRCDRGFRLRDDASSTPCRGGACTNGGCCVPQTCDDYPCGADTVRNVGMQCGSGGCSASVCCTPTCATYTCTGGYTPKNPSTLCPGGVCSTSLCCAVTCGSYSCCPGYDLRPDSATAVCEGGACSLAQCCIPNCNAPTFSCNPGAVKKAGASSISCTTKAGSISTSLGYTGYICTQSKCCDSVCTTNTCSSSQRLKEGMLNQPCANSGTTCQDYCCEAKTCANQNVQCAAPQWRRKSDYAVITCSTCSTDVCCERIPYYCSSATCDAGWTLQASAPTMLCPDQTCTSAYCCLPTCATIACSAFGRPTMSGSASHVCAATGCTADECCGQYCSGPVCQTPGYVLRNPAPACSSLPCQENECCVPSCSSYTCSGSDKTLMSNPSSQICTDGPCNDALCCVNKLCPACPAGYSPRGLASCTTCDTNECCIQNTCANKGVVCDPGHQLISPTPNCVACNQQECCEAICTAAVCGTGYRFEPSQTRCSADPCPMNDAVCCQPNVCGAFPCGSLQVNRPASTQCSGWPCRRDECCNAMDVMCFDANSAIKGCTGGRVPKANAGSIKCANQECTEGVCCDETCASAPSNICGLRPRLASLNTHVCLNQNVVSATGQTANGCLADECCGQYCSTDTSLRCPLNTAMRPDATSFQCAGIACTSRECCQDLCKTIACDANDHMVDPNRACPPGAPCQKSYCCATTTCANNVDLKRFTCPAGYIPIPGTNAEDILCMGECNKDICCTAVTCPSSFTCAPGTTPKASMTSQLCPTGVCSNDNCCQQSCKGWLPSNACPVGMRPSFNMNTSDVACAGGICSSSICCVQNTCTNPDGTGVAFVCSAPSWTQRSDFATKNCPNARCTEADCCVPLCGANPQCDAGYSPRPDAATTPCTSGTCSSSVCCVKTMCPANYRCNSALYVPKSNLPTIPCAGSTCTDRDCCRDQCANIVCTQGTVKNGNTLCAGIPCTNSECCSTQSQCPSNYLCNKNPGDVLKKQPQYCAGSTCTYAECCCTGGCNYCGTQFKGTCPVGSKLNLNTNCGSATCTADICCTGTCINYPCPNGPSDPSLANALCYNPKQCTDADCCVSWGD